MRQIHCEADLCLGSFACRRTNTVREEESWTGGGLSQGCPESRPVAIPNCPCLLKVHSGGSGAGTVLRKPAIILISCLVEDVISG